MLIYIADETRRVMINPDPRLSRNPTSDSVWLGVPTWFEAGNEGSRDEAASTECSGDRAGGVAWVHRPTGACEAFGGEVVVEGE